MNIKWALIAVVVIAAAAVNMLISRGTNAQQSADGKTLAQLAKAGSDLKKPHEVDFFFYFPTKEDAEKAAPKLVALGLSIKIDRSAKGSDWVIQGQKTMIPTEAEFQRLGRLFGEITASQNGEYDGWGSEVVE